MKTRIVAINISPVGTTFEQAIQQVVEVLRHDHQKLVKYIGNRGSSFYLEGMFHERVDFLCEVEDIETPPEPTSIQLPVHLL
jgi:hypothetical protein